MDDFAGGFVIGMSIIFGIGFVLTGVLGVLFVRLLQGWCSGYVRLAVGHGASLIIAPMIVLALILGLVFASVDAPLPNREEISYALPQLLEGQAMFMMLFAPAQLVWFLIACRRQKRKQDDMVPIC